jgi:hypothetical protein
VPRPKQGRWSAEDQRRAGPEAKLPPPEPPPELEPPEADVWRSITSKLPGDWFAPETLPMLRELCRHSRYANDLARELSTARAAIAAVRDDETMSIAERMAALEAGTKTMSALLRSHGYQTERLANIATKLRLTNQAKIPAASAARKARDERAPVDPALLPWNNWSNPQ